MKIKLSNCTRLPVAIQSLRVNVRSSFQLGCYSRFLSLNNNYSIRKFATETETETKSVAPPVSPPQDSDTPLTETIRYFLSPKEFYDLLKEKHMSFYAGVPDSLLKDFCAYVTDVSAPGQHVIAANEGNAVGLAVGYHLATKKFPIVYLQNSGLGNIVNPLLSLVHPKIHGIPMLLLIGWRGEPGKKDEPQHYVQGKVTSDLLTDMGIGYEVLPDYIEGARDSVNAAVRFMDKNHAPYAFLVKRQTFTKYQFKNIEPDVYHMNREEAIKCIVDNTKESDILLATTGFAARELYEYRESLGHTHKHEFLTVGAMGHNSSIALGVSISKPLRQVLCIDGDGAVLMHFGAMSTIGTHAKKNFKHIIINNGCHDSVGGQPTQAFKFDFITIAKSFGYKHTFLAKSKDELKQMVPQLRECEGPALLEIRVNKGARKNLGRPKLTPAQNKLEFMKFLESDLGW